MSKEQVEEIMKAIFKKSDVDNSGALSIAEFQKCCKDADIGLTRKEVNILMHQCDVDGDGMISYDEFVPLCFEMLVEITANNLLESQKEPSELEEFLKAVWTDADSGQTGTLLLTALKVALWGADLGLSRVQMHSICSTAEIEEDEAGNAFVSYMEFAPHAATLIYRMMDMDAQAERTQAVHDQMGAEADMVHGMTQADLEVGLGQLFSAADSSGSGFVPLANLQPLLMGSTLGLTEGEVRAILSSVEVLPNGTVEYASVVKYAFYILQYLAQEAALSR